MSKVVAQNYLNTEYDCPRGREKLRHSLRRAKTENVKRLRMEKASYVHGRSIYRGYNAWFVKEHRMEDFHKKVTLPEKTVSVYYEEKVPVKRYLRDKSGNLVYDEEGKPIKKETMNDVFYDTKKVFAGYQVVPERSYRAYKPGTIVSIKPYLVRGNSSKSNVFMKKCVNGKTRRNSFGAPAKGNGFKKGCSGFKNAYWDW